MINFVNENLVALRVGFDEHPYSKDFNIRWTPTIVTIDSECNEHHRTLGFLTPQELIESLILGMGKTDFDLGEFDPAIESFDKLIGEHPESDCAPEAVYMRGVSLYKKTKEAKHLKEAYEKLLSQYPNSPWKRRAQPYDLL